MDPDNVSCKVYINHWWSPYGHLVHSYKMFMERYSRLMTSMRGVLSSAAPKVECEEMRIAEIPVKARNTFLELDKRK